MKKSGMISFLLRLLKFGVSGGLIVYLLNRFGIEKIIRELGSADTFWLAAAVLFFIGSHLVGSCQWWALLRWEGTRIAWPRVLSFYFVGLFFNNFLISNLGGDLFRMMDIRRSTHNTAAAVSTVFLDRFLGLFILSSMAVAAFVFLAISKSAPMRLDGLFVILAAGWLMMIVFLFDKRLTRPFARIIRKWLPENFALKSREIYLIIHHFGRQRRLLSQLLGLSCIIQGLRIMAHYAVARSLGVHISPAVFFLFVPIIAIAAALPVSLGGVGLREQMGVILLGSVGIPSVQAFSIEFLAYLTAIVSSLPGLFVFAVRKRIVLLKDDSFQAKGRKS
jgi:glycosyltransferase 2 family protein